MEEKRLNEKESLELITHMIQNTQSRLVKGCGRPFLIWGYTTFFVSLLIWSLLTLTHNYEFQWLWFLLPAIGGTGSYLARQKTQPGVKTHIDRIINYIWLVFGIAGFLVSCLSIYYFHIIPILFIILLMMGMGTILTGLVARFRLLVISGIVGALSSLSCLCIRDYNQIIVFAVVFIFMMVIPGHILNKAAGKEQ